MCRAHGIELVTSLMLLRMTVMGIGGAHPILRYANTVGNESFQEQEGSSPEITSFLSVSPLLPLPVKSHSSFKVWPSRR